MLGMLMNLGDVRHSDNQAMMSCATGISRPFHMVREALHLSNYSHTPVRSG